MRLLLIAILTFNLGASATSAQTGDAGSYPLGATPGSPQVSPASLTNAAVLLPLLLLTTTTPTVPSVATGMSPLRPPRHPQSRQNSYDSAVADCVKMWDSTTHMTKQEWSRTCRRVQMRLDNLNVESLMPKTKTTSEKSANGKKQLR